MYKVLDLRSGEYLDGWGFCQSNIRDLEFRLELYVRTKNITSYFEPHQNLIRGYFEIVEVPDV